jgi:hypothetical protein
MRRDDVGTVEPADPNHAADRDLVIVGSHDADRPPLGHRRRGVVAHALAGSVALIER